MFRRLSPRLMTVTLGPARQADAAPKTLKISTGVAFPPTHPTSRLCLELLQEALAAGHLNTLVDVGCGAGVLSLAAAAWGVQLVVALDLAPEAVRETRQNARDNALADSVRVVQGSSECVKAAFDLVVANLPYDVQVVKAPGLSRLAAPAGSLILSGFRDYQESPLREAYLKLGWSVARRAVKDFQHPELPKNLSFTWVAWTLTRP
jgi:ribosomal protein L11 methyltransferase